MLGSEEFITAVAESKTESEWLLIQLKQTFKFFC
jgi:hypothetical protein